MKRTAGALVLLAAASGCVSTGDGPYMAHAFNRAEGNHYGATCGGIEPQAAPGLQGPWGQPVMVNQAPTQQAKAATTKNGQTSLIQRASYNQEVAAPPAMLPQGGPVMTPGGAMMGHGGPTMMAPPGMVAAPGVMPGTGGPIPGGPAIFAAARTEIRFGSPAGMKVAWFAPTPDGHAGFTAANLDTPGSYNFLQGAIYRLRLSDVPNYAGRPFFPTLEVAPGNPKTAAFLAHSAVPVNFTQDDFEQVRAGNYVVKVIYLPDPQYQDLATTGPDEVVSSRLEPGVDPIAEACRRGSILVIVRLGNIDLELANSPAMTAPNPYCPRPMVLPAPVVPGPVGMANPKGMMAPGKASTGSSSGMPNLLPAPTIQPASAPSEPVGKLSMAPSTASPYASSPTTPAQMASQSPATAPSADRKFPRDRPWSGTPTGN